MKYISPTSNSSPNIYNRLNMKMSNQLLGNQLTWLQSIRSDIHKQLSGLTKK